MAATMRIPTEFTAVDKFTSVVSKMTSGVSSFTKTTGAAVSRVNTKIDGMFNKLGNVSQLLLGLSFGAILTSAVQDLKNYEDGVASFRTIVSDLSDKDFAKYTSSINQVAKDTKKSTIDVVMSYEKIAGLNAKFAETSDGIANISKASITLSKASKDELGTATENLVGIMNQFNLGASEADRVINVLAAGQAVGAASITQSAEAYKNFGSVAKGANITLEESQALIQTLGKFSLFGAEAGTKLRGATLQLQKAGIGYASGQFNINDALIEAKKISERLTTQRAKDTFMIKTFGAENITAGKILLANIDTYKEFTKGVTGTAEAQKAAEINSSTLSVKIEELKASFTNLLTTNEQAGVALTFTKNVLGFLAENIETVIAVAVGLIGFVIAIKAINAAMIIGQGIMAAYTAITTFYSGAAVTAALTGASFAAVIWATLAPILLVIAAIALVVATFYYWSDIVGFFGKQWERFTAWIVELWDGVISFFKNFSFGEFFKSIGQAVINWLLWPLKQVLKIVSLIPGSIGDAAKTGLEKLNQFTDLSANVSTSKEVLQSPQEVQAENSKDSRFNGRLDINVNDPAKRTSTETQFGGALAVNLTSTQGF